MKIAHLQFAPVLGDPQASMEKIDSLIGQCAGADVVVLPELANSGYNFTSKEQARESSEEVGKGPFSEFLLSKCRQYGFHLVAGINERDGDSLYNSSILVSSDGIIGKYRKMHLFWNEPDFYQSGNLGLPIFDLGFCKLGMLICFDWIHPEVWRIMAMKGADLICHPSNLVLPGLCQKAIPVHAMMNRIYVITANRVGAEGDKTFTGMSVIADPKGDVIHQASQSEEEAGIVDLDVTLARDKMMTPLNHLFDDRRPEEYALLCEKK
ncbi:carbon-nitrogen hydrolase [bacterium]|nr:carbon-nitrogen hydrolase [bacterium]MBU1881679.1 carbon-nitrogen hydrolase [bacterium]